MINAASSALAVSKALNSLMQQDRGRLLSALIARYRDFSLAEEALQEAMISAAVHWGRSGIPAASQSWLLQVASRKAIDRLRKAKSQKKLTDAIATLSGDEGQEDNAEAIPDERLRLLFTCCHPAIESKSQVALTLRTLGGLSTGEIARAFLDQEATMGQRLSRAKAKIAAAGIPFAVPEPEEWPARLQSVLSVIYLIFNAGYTAGPGQGMDFANEAIWLARMLLQLREGDPEIEGCLALLLITHARRAARIDSNGVLVPITRQDKSLWYRAEIDEGLKLAEQALQRKQPGPYQIKAAIAACHCETDAPDWPQITALYDVLLRFEPTPVVRLNRAFALAESGALDQGFAEVEALKIDLKDYQPFYATYAELLARKGRQADARGAYTMAISLASSSADRAFLKSKSEMV